MEYIRKRFRGWNIEYSTGVSSIEQRMDAIDCFGNSDSNILVATNLLAFGINFIDVDLIVNFEIPTNAEHKVDRRMYRNRKILNLVEYGMEEELIREIADWTRSPQKWRTTIQTQQVISEPVNEYENI